MPSCTRRASVLELANGPDLECVEDRGAATRRTPGTVSSADGRGAVDAATQHVETADAACFFTELDGEQSGTGRHVGGQVGAVGHSRLEHDGRLHVHDHSNVRTESQLARAAPCCPRRGRLRQDRLGGEGIAKLVAAANGSDAIEA